MKKYLLLIFSLIFILSITACKSKQDPITLAARSGIYTGNVKVNNGNTTLYSIVEVKTTGEILAAFNTVPLSTIPPGVTAKPSFNPTSTDTSFTITDDASGTTHTYDIIFTSNTTLTLKDTAQAIDFGTLTKQ